MVQGRKSKTRPCRICRKWFRADPRVGDRQMTCGSKDCRSKWRIRKCAEWNRKNPDYFREIYLNSKLAALRSDGKGKAPPSKGISGGISAPKSSKSPKLLINPVQEVMSAQQIVIIEYMVRLLLKPFQEEMRLQVSEITTGTSQLPHKSISRGDSLGSSP